MKNNLLFKILSSLPVILIALYFIPFLGICLILLRYFMYDNKKRNSTPMYIVGVGILVLIPKALNLILDLAKVDISAIPYLKYIISAELYNVDFINYSKRLICVGVIFLIISFVLKTIFDKVSSKLNSGIRNYINETQRRDAENSRQNDMEIKIKQEKAKNTSYVECPNCGAEIIGNKCNFCRSTVKNIDFKISSIKRIIDKN